MVSESNEAGYWTMQEPEESNTSPISLEPDTRKSFSKRLELRMRSEVEPQRTHLILIGLFFITGLIDSAAYNIWSCFVSMQTGKSYPWPTLRALSEMLHYDRFGHRSIPINTHQATLSSSAWVFQINPSPLHPSHG